MTAEEREAGEGETPEEGERELPAPRRRRGGWGWVALLALLAVVAVGGIEFRARLPGLVRERVLAEARARGVVLEADRIVATGILPWESGPAQVTLEEARLSFERAPGVEATAHEVVVELEGLAPRRVRAKGVALRAGAPAAIFALEDEARTGRLGEIPFEALDVRVRITKLVDALPAGLLVDLERVSVEGGVLAHDEELEVEVPIVPGVKLGPYHAKLARGEERLGITVREHPGVALEVDRALTEAKVTATALDRKALRALLPLVELPDVRVTATLQLALAGENVPAGTVEAKVEGWSPPKPKELGGIVYGKTTTVRARFAREGLLRVGLTELEVKAGALSLRGHGAIDALGGGTVTMELAGAIPCNDLAASAIGAHLGLPAAALAAQIGRGRLRGNVAVTLEVEAPLARPADVVIRPNALIRCSIAL